MRYFFQLVGRTFSNIRLFIQTLMVFVLLSSMIQSAECETYKWVDDKGVMNFSDNLSSVPRKYRGKVTEPGDTEEPIQKSLVISSKNRSSKGPIINEKYDYYEISGRTEQELQQQMNARGISGADGKSHYAYCNWYVRWNYTFGSTPSGCSIATVTTSLDVNYQLPKWVNFEAAPDNLKNKWNRFTRNVELHEYGHKEIGVQTAKEIERAIKSMKSRANCEELGGAANSIGQMIVERSKPEEADYDVRTKHGINQGATFP